VYVSASVADANEIADRHRRLLSLLTPSWAHDDEPVQLSFSVVATNTPNAIDEGEAAYALIRDDAGLPPHSPKLLAVTPRNIGWGDPRYFELIDVAKRFHTEGHWNAAVVTAQTAVEVYVESALSSLLAARNLGDLEPLVMVDRYTLMDQRGQRLFKALTGRTVSVRAVPELAAYRKHVERRNQIVHKGRAATESDARSSITAANGMFGFVGRAWLEGIAISNVGTA
jgi:hypothetical protein